MVDLRFRNFRTSSERANTNSELNFREINTVDGYDADQDEGTNSVREEAETISCEVVDHFP